MNVRVVPGVVVGQRVDDLLRFLGRRGIVEIHERHITDPAFEDWEVGTYLCDIKRHSSFRIFFLQEDPAGSLVTLVTG